MAATQKAVDKLVEKVRSIREQFVVGSGGRLRRKTVGRISHTCLKCTRRWIGYIALSFLTRRELHPTEQAEVSRQDRPNDGRGY